jgi:hypothetical protein
MVVGKVKCLSIGSGLTGFTVDAEYDILQLAVVSDQVVAIVRDDNGDFVASRSVNGEYFEVSELYSSTKTVG